MMTHYFASNSDFISTEFKGVNAADPAVPLQASGGGEGPTPAATPQETKPAELVVEATKEPTSASSTPVAAPTAEVKPSEVIVPEVKAPEPTIPETNEASAAIPEASAVPTEEKILEVQNPAPDVKTPETQASENKVPEVKASEANAEIPTTEVKAEDVKTPEVAAPELTAPQVIAPEVTTPEVQTPETKAPEAPDEAKSSTIVEAKNGQEESKVESNGVAKGSGDWLQRESDLLKKIEELEKVKIERSEDRLSLELKMREDEIDLLKTRIRNLETELQAAMSKPSGKNHEMIENIKLQHEELLSKARGMIFEKTKMVKNQELQIEALSTQVQSLKDINTITKDLLEIRNSEVKAMEERFQAMEARFKAEKERYGLVLQRATTSTNINDDLRKEYETQLAIFKDLREKYEQKVQALVSENAQLKALYEAKKHAGGPS